MPSIDMSGTKADKSEQEVTSKEMQQSGGGGRQRADPQMLVAKHH